MKKENMGSTPQSASLDVVYFANLYYVTPKSNALEVCKILNKFFNRIVNDYVRVDNADDATYKELWNRHTHNLLRDAFSSEGFCFNRMFEKRDVDAILMYLGELESGLMNNRHYLKTAEKEVRFFNHFTFIYRNGKLLDDGYKRADSNDIVYKQIIGIAMFCWLYNSLVENDETFVVFSEKERMFKSFGDIENTNGIPIPEVTETLTTKNGYKVKVTENVARDFNTILDEFHATLGEWRCSKHNYDKSEFLQAEDTCKFREDDDGNSIVEDEYFDGNYKLIRMSLLDDEIATFIGRFEWTDERIDLIDEMLRSLANKYGRDGYYDEIANEHNTNEDWRERSKVVVTEITIKDGRCDFDEGEVEYDYVYKTHCKLIEKPNEKE